MANNFLPVTNKINSQKMVINIRIKASKFKFTAGTTFLTSLIRESDRMVTGWPENISDTVCDEWLTVLWFEKISFKQTVAKF